MKAHEGVEVQFQAFLILALDGGEWSASRPSHFIPGKVGPRAGLEAVET